MHSVWGSGLLGFSSEFCVRRPLVLANEKEGLAVSV